VETLLAGTQSLLDRVTALLPESVERLRGPEGIENLLGEGKDGAVYQMIGQTDLDARLFRYLAVKVWHPEFRSRSQEVAYQREAWAALQKSCVRVPMVLYESQPLGAFVMERVPGATLARAVRLSRRRISEAFTEMYFDGIRSLHAANVIHGDPHTGNVMVSNPTFATADDGREVLVDGTPWIIDFSRARGAGVNTDLEFLQEHLEGIVVEDPRP
jgi:RIO-like serine/threonine protein kinase